MRKRTLMRLESPYRDPMSIWAYDFGEPDADGPWVGVVGSMRGNEVQQMYIAASLVRALQAKEDAGLLSPCARITVVPCANPFSVNLGKRFWPLDNTDINRMFPGYDQGETTQRIAGALFEAIKDCNFGVQLCSFYQPGQFEPHVRITDTGALDLASSWELAEAFGLPYAVLKQPSPFDTTTLNYNWQVWGCRAFSLYSSATDRIDVASATTVLDSMLRFLGHIGVVAEAPAGGCATRRLEESGLLTVRTSKAGFFRPLSQVNDAVLAGDTLAEVRSCEDCSLLERLVSPGDGVVFFRHDSVLINEDTIAFRVAP